MVHAVSNKGIVGLGALGRAIDGFLDSTYSPAAVLFAVKAFSLQQALLEQADQWPEKLPFVTLCNGYIWPVIEKVYDRLGRRPIRIGMTTIGSTITSDGILRVFSANTLTAWGHWPDPKVPSIHPDKTEMDLLKKFPGGAWYDDVRPTIRTKWILNVVINSVVAAYRLKQNGLLNDHQRDVEEALIEAIDLAQKLWPDLPLETPEKAHLAKLLWQVVDATSGNQNSMFRDVSSGRQTESEYLAGLSLHYDGFPVLKRLHKSIVG